MEIRPVYLVMVDGDGNHNKYYRMIPQGDRFVAEYGRVGAGMQTRSYAISQFRKKYSEKIAKGYVDRTALMEDLIVKDKPKGNDGFKAILNRVIADIVDRLQAMANKAVADNYTVSSNKVTADMVSSAQQLLGELSRAASAGGYPVEKFNTALIELFGIIPRKMPNVNVYLAQHEADYEKILQREQDLLDVMRGQIYVPAPVSEEDAKDEGEQTILEAHGLIFEEITEEDAVKIKSCLGSCADKFHRAWRVTNHKTQKAFDEFVHSGQVGTKLLWHGSRNENWWSIIKSGLILRPNAIITGKMFGYGIYFATKARKSLGYTSISGSYWAKGNSSSGFMGLYEVAYGKPYDVHSFHSSYHNLDYDGLQRMCPGAHCLHAHEGQMLRNDEIIVYKECQTTIKYLVELRE